MVANLFGDFVKGKDYTYLPEIVQEGVTLHRQIDDYIDHHPEVTELRLQLYKDLPKVAGIAIDLYFDHLLAKQWSQYHTKSLHQFVLEFTNYALHSKHLKFEHPSFEYPEKFQELLQSLHQYRILEKYAEIEGLTLACRGLSRRISFPNVLDTAPTVFLNHQSSIESTFEIFMQDALRKFK